MKRKTYWRMLPPLGDDLKPEEIGCMAYQDWQQRVRPIEIPEEDRLRAEEDIKQHLNETFTATASIPGRKPDRAWFPALQNADAKWDFNGNRN
jgi:hypothetical protein